MPLIFEKGDVLNSGEDLVIHGCNCFCTMGGGIARQVSTERPNAWAIDQATLSGSKNKLGTFTYAMDSQGITVNAYTQYGYSRSGVSVDYGAVEDCMRSIVTYFGKAFNFTRFAMPRIGCGLAGGDWNVIEDILEQVLLSNPDVTFVVYDFQDAPVPPTTPPDYRKLFTFDV
jgi:O-acetyl-ADP-ribose deacetylase (regulator of RNase III)